MTTVKNYTGVKNILGVRTQPKPKELNKASLNVQVYFVVNLQISDCRQEHCQTRSKRIGQIRAKPKADSKN